MVTSLSFVVAMTAGVANARDCTSDEYDWAEYVSEQLSTQLVDEYGGGRDVVTTLLDCSFNPYSDRFRVRIRTDWNGALVQTNHYAVEGQLELGADGEPLEWAQLAESESLSALREDMIGLAIGAVILGGIASALQEPAQSTAQ